MDDEELSQNTNEFDLEDLIYSEKKRSEKVNSYSEHRGL
jgi:hypothetical protein